MAQTPDASGSEAETCRIALEAALEKGVSFCETTETRLEVLGQIVGVDGTALDSDAALDAGPGTGAADQQTREWVLARAEEMIDTGTEEPLDAINRAWSEASREIGVVDDEPDDAAAALDEATDGDEAADGGDGDDADTDDDVDAEPDASDEDDDATAPLADDAAETADDTEDAEAADGPDDTEADADVEAAPDEPDEPDADTDAEAEAAE